MKIKHQHILKISFVSTGRCESDDIVETCEASLIRKIVNIFSEKSFLLLFGIRKSEIKTTLIEEVFVSLGATGRSSQ